MDSHAPGLITCNLPAPRGIIVHYEDDIYGPVDITEPALLDLMQTEAMQRLRGVLQHGITGLIGITSPTTRFDHSVGVMLLARRMGASLEEQIAALLHDVSHTAFSHVIDHVFGSPHDQSYHEEMKEAYIAGTDLPVALAGHGYDWRDFLHEEHYTLLEQPLPRLCADRLDYFLRDSPDLQLATIAECRAALPHLTVAEGRIAVDDLDVARWMGDTFIAADDASWANFREVGLYELTAQAIRMGLAQGVITEADIWLTDEVVWNKLQAANDSELQAQLALVSPDTKFAWDEDSPHFRVRTKLRSIDPDVLQNGRLQPLSALDIDFARRREDYLHRKGGLWPMRVITFESEGDIV